MQFNFKLKIVFIIIFIFFGYNFILAQNNKADNIIISWQTSNFVPNFFRGKILPSPGSMINVSLELVQNNKLVDLSNTKIYWYVNNELISNIKGNKKINFLAPNDTKVDIRVELPELNILKTIEIPITKPKIVINAPFPKKQVYSNNFDLVAYPYFFNIPNNFETNEYLFPEWQINRSPATPYSYDPFKINIQVIGENSTSIIIESKVSNLINNSEVATSKLELKFIK
ncbi:MAG: hypothetical protein NZ484_01140 [Patescibacteria group bacterium]|nr:hypothetical protein [Patescibacteria group bacterium]MCX7589733.1 hypothetical protein [Patescibacteria group bacterium]MDW8279908.1 hypothetical protein [bacterium]